MNCQFNAVERDRPISFRPRCATRPRARPPLIARLSRQTNVTLPKPPRRSALSATWPVRLVAPMVAILAARPIIELTGSISPSLAFPFEEALRYAVGSCAATLYTFEQSPCRPALPRALSCLTLLAHSTCECQRPGERRPSRQPAHKSGPKPARRSDSPRPIAAETRSPLPTHILWFWPIGRVTARIEGVFLLWTVVERLPIGPVEPVSVQGLVGLDAIRAIRARHLDKT